MQSGPDLRNDVSHAEKESPQHGSTCGKGRSVALRSCGEVPRTRPIAQWTTARVTEHLSIAASLPVLPRSIHPKTPPPQYPPTAIALPARAHGKCGYRCRRPRSSGLRQPGVVARIVVAALEGIRHAVGAKQSFGLVKAQSLKLCHLAAREASPRAFMHRQRLQGALGERLSGIAKGLGHRLGDSQRDFHMRLSLSGTAVRKLRRTPSGRKAGGRAPQTLDRNQPDKFFDVTYPLPSELTRGQHKVTVRIQAQPGKWAGGVFGVRMLKRP